MHIICKIPFGFSFNNIIPYRILFFKPRANLIWFSEAKKTFTGWKPMWYVVKQILTIPLVVENVSGHWAFFALCHWTAQAVEVALMLVFESACVSFIRVFNEAFRWPHPWQPPTHNSPNSCWSCSAQQSTSNSWLTHVCLMSNNNARINK